ncbi:hypothetical protein IMCC3317_17820 [Kordia antarctica]|uniref:Uncharacterized protein n=1 Tax=Kordia antarctica TaxID=1218801 RepID=A0A7L4ZJ16_9FLAO|nr:hypothetical protein [Kordia antarctica]QHI36419.1 hypothetical protein IMCC3317_17820 [Kordia antarctica]
MSNSIIINRSKHPSILADHRMDPVTKKLLKVGDEVCVCAKCKTVYLKSVWINSQRKSCCGQNVTLSYIPNKEYGKSESIPIITKSYQNHFILFLLATIVFAALFGYWHYLYEKTQDRYSSIYSKNAKLNNELNIKILSLTNDVSLLEKEKLELEQKLNSSSRKLSSSSQRLNSSSQKLEQLSVKVENANDVLSSTIFILGVKYEEIENYSIDYGKYQAKIYFTVNQPIYFKSAKIEAKGEGYINAFIYDANNNLVCQVYKNSVKDGSNTLNFNYSIAEGSYYMTHQGNVDLTFISDFDEYPISDNVISIKGTDFGDTHYMYFYQWEYQIKLL